ncbi:MAG: hypothetical protein KDK99_01675 [Verrucomicrobiales bacterium]|nr:hypothetical protein [Verrucomicrobiales bacterium]
MMRFLVGWVLISVTAVATAAEKRPAAHSRPAPVVSPVMVEGGGVRFQLKAAKAQSVMLTGEMMEGQVELTRDEAGLWSVTLDAVEPGLYGYSFIVDGVRVVDPGNAAVKPSRNNTTSILQIPGGMLHDFNEVPHGTVHQHDYHSASIDRFRQLRVYTPPGYETGAERYPLLVLQHGHSDNFASWTTYGKAHWILDNLIAQGKAVPMIVVMLDGHPREESYGDGRSVANTEELKRDLLEVALPMVERLYRVKPGRENRALAGLSMGGLHTMSIGMTSLESFAWLGSFSGAMPDAAVMRSAMEDAAGTNARLKLLWIACGEKDFLLEENQAMVAALEQAGVKHEWHLTEGAHQWWVWRKYLAEFAPRLFR